MEKRKLGRGGPEISAIGYGAWEAGGDQWEPGRSDREAVDAMRAAIDAGINWIDTAEAYGHGHSEELVRQAIDGRRDEVFVFTKVASFVSGVRPDEIRKAIRGSLSRLGIDHVDLYQIHWPAEDIVRAEEMWATLAELAEEGLTRYVGVSNFDRDLIERCMAIRHVDSVQNQFSLLHQKDRDELLPWLAEKGIGYLGYAPLAFGLLTGAITEETRFPTEDWRSGKRNVGYYQEYFAPEIRGRHLRRVEALRPVAERLGVPLSTLALRAALEVPGITGVIAGTRNPRHVAENARAGGLDLDPDVVEEIDAIFRGD